MDLYPSLCYLKSDNLQYDTVGQWVDGTIVSGTIIPSTYLSSHCIVGFQFFLQPMVCQYLLQKTLGIAQKPLNVSGILCQIPMDQRLP